MFSIVAEPLGYVQQRETCPFIGVSVFLKIDGDITPNLLSFVGNRRIMGLRTDICILVQVNGGRAKQNTPNYTRTGNKGQGD